MTEIFATRLIENNEFLKKRDLVASLFPEEVRQRLLSFNNNIAMQRSMLGELLSRSVLSQELGISLQEINFCKGEQGKPFLKDHKLFFNISHSGEWVVLATSDQEVGIDIEKIRNVDFRIAERYFSSDEKEKLFALQDDQKISYFLDLWTLKESYLKLLGKGLTKSLSTFTISGKAGEFKLNHDQHIEHEVYFRQFTVDEFYKTSVCAYSNKFNMNIRYFSIADLIPH